MESDKKINGKKVVIITGASSGIGKETAKIYNNNGYIVYNLSKDEPLKEEGEKGLDGIIYINCDVRDYLKLKEIIKGIAKKEGRIDIAIANAGCRNIRIFRI